MIKKRILLVLFLCLLIFVPIVSAETLTGTIGAGLSTSQNSYTLSPASISMWGANITIQTDEIERTKGLAAIVHFDPSGYRMTFDAGAPTYLANIPFIAYNSSQGIEGTGTMGYARTFNALGVEQAGYQYFLFDTYTGNLKSGKRQLVLVYNHSAVYGMQPGGTYPYNPTANCNVLVHDVSNVGISWATGYTGDSNNYGIMGNYIVNTADGAIATYTATKPSGLGITGTITKTVSGTNYPSRAWVWNGATDAVLTNDAVTNGNNLYFDIPSSTVKLGIETPNLKTPYNTSVLFGSGSTPTPTPTPYGGGSYNGTFTVKNGNTQAVISNAYVEVTSPTLGSTFSGYTDVNGNISVIYGYKNILQEFGAWKSGFQNVAFQYTATTDFTRTVYMYPETGPDPGIPATVNIDIVVRDQNGNAPISGAYVALKDDSYGTAQVSLLTNATGHAYFQNFPASAMIDMVISKSGYTPLSEYFGFLPASDFLMTKYLSTSGGVTPTPTPTPSPYDTLTLVATPDSINLGQSVSLVGSSSNVTRVTYAGGLRRTVFMVNKHAQAYPFDFNEIGMFENVNATYWKFRANYSAAWGAPSTASPLTLTHTPDTNGLYTYAFIGYETLAGGSGAIATAGTDFVTINGGAGAGSLKMVLTAMDGKTTAHLMNYQMNLTDDSSGIITEFGNVSYEKEMSLPRGNSYTLRASKENYEEGSKQFVVPVSPTIVDGTYGAIAVVNLYPSGWITAGNTSVAVRAYDAETYYPLSSVQINIDGYPVQYTGTDGASASFSIPQNTAYTVIASKSGYCSVTESKNTGTVGYQLVSMFMKYGACTGTTPTPTPTPTPSVTVTPIGGYGNLTGEAMVCGALPEGATIIDVLKNSLACNGLETKESQNLGLAMLIMLFAGIILGRVAKGIGVLAGVIAGAVISMAMGFLPFWIIIVVIIIAGLVFASKIFWSSGGQ